jgi:hypothetical protein
MSCVASLAILVWRMASVRGPEGFIVNLAQRLN